MGSPAPILCVKRGGIMTNREWLNTLDNQKFANVILAKVSEFQCKNFDYYGDIFDITFDTDTPIDFENWINEEHSEEL